MFLFVAGLFTLKKVVSLQQVNFFGNHPLDSLGRDFGPAEIVAAVQACDQAGIACMLDLLVGGPGETPETAAETIRVAKGLAVTTVGVAVGIRIYPGTTLAEMVEKEGFDFQNPNLRGKVKGNEEYLEPVFYISSALGPAPEAYVAELVGSDRRFYFMLPDEAERNYNYNQNLRLLEAIRQGFRGAYWHILSMLDKR